MTTKLSLLALLLGLGLTASAQVNAGIKGGLNLSTLDGTINLQTDVRPAYHAGLFVTAWMGKSFAFQPEVLYSEQGVKFSHLAGSSPRNTLRMSVVDVPLLLKVYMIGRHLQLHAGPQFGILVGAEEELVQNGGARAVTNDVKHRFKTADFAVAAGVGVAFSRFTVDVRGIYGLTDLNDDPDEAAARARLDLGGLHHRVVQVSGGIRLF